MSQFNPSAATTSVKAEVAANEEPLQPSQPAQVWASLSATQHQAVDQAFILVCVQIAAVLQKVLAKPNGEVDNEQT